MKMHKHGLLTEENIRIIARCEHILVLVNESDIN